MTPRRCIQPGCRRPARVTPGTLHARCERCESAALTGAFGTAKA